MISKKQLIEITKQTGLSLYQQEKDYLLKLFLFNYYKKYDDAIFKGGTCIKYLYGLARFSEDLDFNIKNPVKFKQQVNEVLKQVKGIGLENSIKKEEMFKEAYAAEITFKGPLFNGSNMSLNKIRIDAGYRLATMLEPSWNLVNSEYAETASSFLVKSMDAREMLVEKMLAVFDRKKGRDLYDIWFLIKRGTTFDKVLFKKKAMKLGKKPTYDFSKIVSEKEYLNDLSKLTQRIIPYNQIITDIKSFISTN